MGNRSHLQKQASSQSTFTPITNPFQPRPFAPPTEIPPQQQETPDLQAEQEKPKGFGYNLGKISITNRNGVGRLPIQTKLTIGQPGDKYEQEADRVAAQVVNQINTPVAQQSVQGQTIQREEMSEEEELMMKPMVQRQEALGGGTATPDLEASINQARSGGQPLGEPIRRQMESAFGANFSGVKIHSDTRSDLLNRSIQARAFTTGNDIFFRQGAYNPGSRGGQELLAHELTHVVQQSGNVIQRDSSKMTEEQIKHANRIREARIRKERNRQERKLPPVNPQNPSPINKENHLDLNALATADPEKFIKENCGGEWEKARHYYREGKLNMAPLLQFRGQKVGSNSDLVQQVIDETYQHVQKKNRELTEKYRLTVGSLGEAKKIIFNAPGSQSPTSDIDYNLKGDGTEFAVIRFNELFKLEFGYEAGTFFDVNVYSKDFLPDVFSPGNDRGVKKSTAKKNKALIAKLEQGELAGEEKEKAQKLKYERDNNKSNNPTEERTGKGAKEFDLTGKFAERDLKVQEVYSLVKMQMYMSVKEWDKHKINTLKGLGKDSSLRKKIEKQFVEAEGIFKKYIHTIIKGIETSISDQELQKLSVEDLKKRKEKHEEEDFDATLVAHNRAYEAKLNKIEGLRDQIKVLNAKIQDKNNQDDKQVLLNQVQDLAQQVRAMINESLLYANEAYVTEGGVAHVVGTKQIKANLIFSADQYIQAFNENIGDAFKELHRHEKDGAGYAAVKAGKYIHRAANEAKHYSRQVGKKDDELDIKRKINQLGKELEAVKNAGNASEANTKGMEIVGRVLEISYPTLNHVKLQLLELSKRVTQHYNNYKYNQRHPAQK